jgi:uroporphyrinogen decarboxylase
MMIYTHKERVRRALLHQTVDRIPTQINYTKAIGEKISAYFGIPLDGLPGLLGNHLVRVDIAYPEKYSDTGESLYDWWGAGHDTGEEGYFINISPLADDKDLDDFQWPDPREPDLMGEAKNVISIYGDEFFIVPNFGWALFERAWSLRGFEQLLMDMVLDRVYVEELLDRIVEIQLVLIERFVEIGVDGGYFGDDYGAQKGLLFSPIMWRELIKPRLARLIEPFRARNLPVLMHSDGQIQQILPDLVEIGVTTINPVQPEVLDHNWLRDHFEGELSFYGGVSTQTVLPNGTADEVRRAVLNCTRTLAPDRVGLLISPSHRLMSDIPMANVEALLAAFREF